MQFTTNVTGSRSHTTCLQCGEESAVAHRRTGVVSATESATDLNDAGESGLVSDRPDIHCSPEGRASQVSRSNIQAGVQYRRADHRLPASQDARANLGKSKVQLDPGV